ncbi:putative Zn(2)-C6 fungal-type domain-containing protein [Seiridium unicorne]|uniref:Zn(2)-C6 fungal-type domain-containing protein n=1 Tax=Seiridium unicorne TaxID=138068 RepID=A0ABR2UM46_9PEZI
MISRIERGAGRWSITNLLRTVEESVPNIPAHAVADGQAPGQGGLVQINEQADGQIPQQDALVVEAGAWQAKVRGEAREQQGQIAEARDRGHKGRVRQRRVRDVERDMQVPERLRNGRASAAAAAAAAAHLTVLVAVGLSVGRCEYLGIADELHVNLVEKAI